MGTDMGKASYPKSIAYKVLLYSSYWYLNRQFCASLLHYLVAVRNMAFTTSPAFHLLRVVGRLEPIPAVIGQERGYTLY